MAPEAVCLSEARGTEGVSLQTHLWLEPSTCCHSQAVLAFTDPSRLEPNLVISCFL